VLVNENDEHDRSTDRIEMEDEMSIIRGSVIGLAGAVGAGVLAWPMATASADTDEVRLKRDEQATEIVAVDDEDDDDTNRLTNDDRVTANTSDTRSKASRDTRSKASNDATNSRKTGVSRDRDRSRGDLTRDWTRDGGGDRTRDWTKNKTNDKSRNDTRRKPRR
jgi:hypothetical protein